MKREELERERARVRARVERLVGEGPLPRFDEALTHPSLSNESSLPDNQRLEFLGDAILGLCVSEELVRAHPAAAEGQLTRMRSALVNAEALGRWARSIDLGPAIALGRGARNSNEREQTNVLADAVEALVACVYDARGIVAARALVADVMRETLASETELETRDAKSRLQERVQAEGQAAPTYRVVETRGTQHDPTFEVEVLVAERVYGTGTGRSKRLAEQAAARAALEALDAATLP